MSGGPILPSSIYLGGASGNLYPSFYVPATNTNGAGAVSSAARWSVAAFDFNGSFGSFLNAEFADRAALDRKVAAAKAFIQA